MYVGVPPPAVTVAVPFVPPLQLTGVDVALAVNAVGCVTVVVAVRVQPLASVTVQVYVPAASDDAVDPVPPDGAHEYVYGDTPPPAVTVALPVLPPLHNTGVDVALAVSNGGCVMVTVAMAVHPFASVTVQV